MKSSITSRRTFIRSCGVGVIAASSGLCSSDLLAQTGIITPVAPGPEVDQFKKAQQTLLLRYGVSARSRYLKLNKPPLTAHVLEAGRGMPILLLHGGGATAAQFAPLMGVMQKEFLLFAPDRPGCGLTDKIDYHAVPFREHAVDFVGGILDGLDLPKAAIVANSMGGYWAIVFALAHRERVSKLVLLGEPAASGPPKADAPAPPPSPKVPNIGGIRAKWKGRLGMNIDHVSTEIWDAELAGAKLPGAGLGWDSMVDEFVRRQKLSTYALRPELKNLRPETLFIWGDNDSMGTGAKKMGAKMGEEMAAIAPHARCEILNDAGHMPWIDQTERCAQLTIEFLKSAG